MLGFRAENLEILPPNNSDYIQPCNSIMDIDMCQKTGTMICIKPG